MTVKEVIKTIDNWSNRTVADLLAILTTPAIVVEDDTQKDWAQIALIVGPQACESIRLALVNANLTWAALQLAGNGLRLNNPQVQQVLRGFAQANVPGCQTLADIGRRLVSPAEQHQLGSLTEQQVQTALDAAKLDDTKAFKQSSAASRYNAYMDALEAWDGTGQEPSL